MCGFALHKNQGNANSLTTHPEGHMNVWTEFHDNPSRGFEIFHTSVSEPKTDICQQFVCLPFWPFSPKKISTVRKDQSPPSIHHARPSIFNISQCNMTDLAGSHRGETFLTLQPQCYLKITYISQHRDIIYVVYMLCLILLTISTQSSLKGNSLIKNCFQTIILPAGATGLKVQQFN